MKVPLAPGKFVPHADTSSLKVYSPASVGLPKSSIDRSRFLCETLTPGGGVPAMTVTLQMGVLAPMISSRS